MLPVYMDQVLMALLAVQCVIATVLKLFIIVRHPQPVLRNYLRLLTALACMVAFYNVTAVWPTLSYREMSVNAVLTLIAPVLFSQIAIARAIEDW